MTVKREKILRRPEFFWLLTGAFDLLGTRDNTRIYRIRCIFWAVPGHLCNRKSNGRGPFVVGPRVSTTRRGTGRIWCRRFAPGRSKSSIGTRRGNAATQLGS